MCDEDWDADMSSTSAVKANYNGNQNNFSASGNAGYASSGYQGNDNDFGGSKNTGFTSESFKRTSIGRGRGKFNSDQSTVESGFGSYKPNNRKCFKCGQEGHISRDCPSSGGASGDAPNSNGFGSGSRNGYGKKSYNNDRDNSNGYGFEKKEYNSNKDNSNGFGGGYGKKDYSSNRDDSNGFGGGFGGGFDKKDRNNDREDSNGFGSSFGSGFGKKDYGSNNGFGSDKPRNNACYKCGEEGHISRDCPSGGGGNTRNKGCFKCGEEGHMSRDCPSGGGGNTRNKGCFKCGEEGHISRDCPSGGGGNTRNKGCFKCGEEGHMSRECPSNNGSSSKGGFGNWNSGGDSTRDNDGGGFNGNSNDDGDKPSNSNCFKCDKPGHFARDCPDAESGDGVKREHYIPPPPPEDEEEMYDSMQRGINFSKYDSIPVEVSGDNPPPPINTFKEAEMTETIAANVARAKYEVPTPVQKYSIPIINSGRDLMACAQTGSGKTAAFLLPAITQMIRSGLQSSSFSNKQSPQAIIVGPTRELVNQIYLEARKFARNSICRACVAYGGTSVRHQLGDIQRGCNILIATPGRLMDFISKGIIGLDHVQFLILDEADRMLDMGFEGEIRKLVSSPEMPGKTDRQTLMFSATFPDEMQKLAHDFLKDDFLFLTVGRVGGACSDVAQNIVLIDQNDKREKLIELLVDVSETRARTLVFVETKRSADFLACSLSQSGYPTTSIHGDRLQREREEALRDFKRGDCPILIATSVAARGLDIPKVEHVINYDLPKDIDEYVHRIGRTGRCGNLGRATSFYDDGKDKELARCLIKVLSQSLQEVPSWLEGCADHAIGSSFGNDRSGGFGSRDTRTKGNNRRGGDFGENGRSDNQGFSSSRATGDYDYNDGGGFGSAAPASGNTGGSSAVGGGGNAYGEDDSWD